MHHSVDLNSEHSVTKLFTIQIASYSGIWNLDMTGFQMVESRPVVEWSGFLDPIWKPNKCPVFKCSFD